MHERPVTLVVRLSSCLLAASLGLAGAGGQEPHDPEWEVWQVVEKDPVAATLAERGALQRQRNVPRLVVPFDFRFEDRLEASGIRFKNRVVDDGGKYYKMSHYDHGNGVAMADVDGDGLLDLYFVSQLGANGLWRNLGGGRFEDWTQRGGVAVSDRIGVSAAFADIDNDGDPDLVVTTVRGGTPIFENQGQGRFVERTQETGSNYVGHPSAPIFFDFDLDGGLDLLLVNVGSYTTEQLWNGAYVGRRDAFEGHLYPERGERSLLYRNLGSFRFAEVSAEVGLRDESWSGDALVLDLNRDRYPDFYLLNMQGDDHYYQNQAGRRFVDGTAMFPQTPWGTMGAVQLDFDNDGRLDFFLTDMHSDMSEEVGPDREHLKANIQFEERYLQGGTNNIWGNAFFHQLADGRFEEISDRLGVETYWPWGVSAGDLNADGYEDLFITAGMNFPWRYAVNSLLLNNGGREFVASEFILGVEPRRGGRTHGFWFALDCRGEDRDHGLCERRPNGRFHVEGALGSRSSLLVDLDRDGDLDIVTADFNSAPQILVSDLAQRSSVAAVEVVLVGKQSNRDGLGATVELDAGDRTQTRYKNGKSGYLSQSSFPLYFGLAGGRQVDRVRVWWPSGCRQTSAGPYPAGSRIVIEESCAAAPQGAGG
jgi:hypothetical protein